GFDEVAKSGLIEDFMYQDSVGRQREKLLVALTRLAQFLLQRYAPSPCLTGGRHSRDKHVHTAEVLRNPACPVDRTTYGRLDHHAKQPERGRYQGEAVPVGERR